MFIPLMPLMVLSVSRTDHLWFLTATLLCLYSSAIWIVQSPFHLMSFPSRRVIHDMMTTATAPSLISDELPAVTLPPILSIF